LFPKCKVFKNIFQKLFLNFLRGTLSVIDKAARMLYNVGKDKYIQIADFSNK